MKNFLLTALLVVTTLTTFAQCPGGVTTYGAADDMTTTGTVFGHAAGYNGVSWYPNPDSVISTTTDPNYPYYKIYHLSRSENPGKLTVHATNADSLNVSFGINFPSNGIDLSGAATMSIDVDNSAQPTTLLYFTAVLTDWKGYQLSFMDDTISLYNSFYPNYNNNYKKKFTDTLSASDSTVISSSHIGNGTIPNGKWPAFGQSQYSTASAKQTVLFDFKNGWSINPGPSDTLPVGQTENYPCATSSYINGDAHQYAWYCPSLTHSLFDMKHVVTISFFLNSTGVLNGKLTNPDLVGEAWNIDYPVFTGTVLLDNFAIGACDSIPPQCNIALNVSSYSNVSCNRGGIIALNEAGATAPYTYNINGQTQQSNLFTDLNPGKYTITITDANRCTDTISQIIAQAAPLSVFIQADSSSCSSTSTDSILTAVASGGISPYQYTWTILNSILTDTQSVKYSGDSEYMVSVTDATGCTATSTAFVILPGIIINTYQANDSLFVIPSGGKPPYTYSWQVTSQFPAYPLTNVPVISPKPYCIIDSGGYYTVTVTDSVECYTYTTFIASDPVITYNLTGHVSNYNNNQNSKVYLLTLANDSTVTVLDSLIMTSSTFQFSNLNSSSVYVYYVPDTSSSPFSLPTYYAATFATTFFDNATPVVFNSRDTTITFAAVIGADSGAYSFEGTITSATSTQRVAYNFRTVSNGSVAGIKIVLVDSLGNPVRISVTNSAGHFYFNKLKSGNYTLWVDQPFFANDNPPVVSLASTNNQPALYLLTSNSLQRVSSITSITGITTTTTLIAYPNPTTGNLTITTPEAGQVSVYNTLGELVTSQAVTAGNTTISLDKAATGIYTVILIGQTNNYAPVKVVKN